MLHTNCITCTWIKPEESLPFHTHLKLEPNFICYAWLNSKSYPSNDPSLSMLLIIISIHLFQLNQFNILFILASSEMQIFILNFFKIKWNHTNTENLYLEISLIKFYLKILLNVTCIFTTNYRNCIIKGIHSKVRTKKPWVLLVFVIRIYPFIRNIQQYDFINRPSV